MPDVMPASRTNRPFFNVSEHLKTLMFIGISSFYLSHRISGGNMTYRQNRPNGADQQLYQEALNRDFPDKRQRGYRAMGYRIGSED